MLWFLKNNHKINKLPVLLKIFRTVTLFTIVTFYNSNCFTHVTELTIVTLNIMVAIITIATLIAIVALATKVAFLTILNIYNSIFTQTKIRIVLQIQIIN